jgi:hypothetical protein
MLLFVWRLGHVIDLKTVLVNATHHLENNLKLNLVHQNMFEGFSSLGRYSVLSGRY